MPTKIIDPENLSPEETKNLYQFFNTSNLEFWKKHIPYKHDNGQLMFDNHVIKRSRKAPKIGCRYEFIGVDKLGKGASGKVLRIKGTLAIEEDHADFKKKNRAVKIQLGASKKNVEREYIFSLRPSHLKPKMPIFFGQASFMVLKEMPGEELFEIILNDHFGKKVLTIAERIELSQKLLLALKEQVYDKGLTHRDLKPENIMVDMQAPISIYIIDYGLSIESGCQDDTWPGSLPYAAPEVLTRSSQSPKMDIFSMGRILALLWRVSTRSYEIEDFGQIIKNAKNVNLDSLFHGLDDLDTQNRLIIQTALMGMVNPNPTLRLNLEEVRELFSLLKPPQPELLPQPALSV